MQGRNPRSFSYFAALAAILVISTSGPVRAEKPGGVRGSNIDVSTRSEAPTRVDLNPSSSVSTTRFDTTFGGITNGQLTSSPSVNIAGNPFPNRTLPRDLRTGAPTIDSPTTTMPAATGPHTQLGRRDGRDGEYNQAREFDTAGKPVRDIDFTDHGRPAAHSNPHQHRYLENLSGGSPIRGSAESLN